MKIRSLKGVWLLLVSVILGKCGLCEIQHTVRGVASVLVNPTDKGVVSVFEFH